MTDAEDSNANVAVILPAAGSGRRFGAERNKLFETLADPHLVPLVQARWGHNESSVPQLLERLLQFQSHPIWLISLIKLCCHRAVARAIVPVSRQDHDYFCESYGDVLAELNAEIVLGGAQRSDSVLSGLDCLSSDATIKFVAIHDAARPLIRQRDLENVFATVIEKSASILAVPIHATVKQSFNSGQSCCTLDRGD